MIIDEMQKILEKHKLWVEDGEGGVRADLSEADLRRANLFRADLRRANLRGADLSCAYLLYANLCGADLRRANLRRANLRGADLCAANLCGADLCGADMRGADLCAANLCGADLCGADMRGADLRGAKNVPYIPMVCPDTGSFTAWKKAHAHIIKLLVPDDAKRSSAMSRKCRCSKAQVIAIETIDGQSAEITEIASDYDGNFIYRIGETVSVSDFCEDRFAECAAGIHFFIDRQEAVDY